MKELSIEEKARRYDEAIEKAKKMIKDITNIGGVAKVDDIQYLFPELKESEDERIRGAIIDHLKDNNLTEWAAWLEKKGENNMVISEATKQKLEDNLNKALEKETPESWNEFLDEQKPAWSEEDARMLNFVVEYLERLDRPTGNSCVNWLKTLKDRVQPQPKQEWNEKDERLKND